MTKILFLAKYNHDFEYFGKINSYINANYQHAQSNLLLNIPFFTLSLFFIFRKMPITVQELSNVLDYELKRKRIKYSSIKFKIFSIFLILASKLYFFKYQNILKKGKYDAICLWGGYHVMQQVVALIAKKNNIKVFYFENGYLPNTTAVDLKGTNFASSIPKDKNFYNSIQKPFKNVKFVERKIFHNSQNIIKLPKNYIFCPFQDWLDSQILLHSPWVKNMEEFFNIISNLLEVTPKNTYFVIKKHPNCKKSYLKLELNADERIIFANENPTYDLIKNSTAVLTINSSVGVESLMMQKKVITLGNSIYSTIGLTMHCNNIEDISYAINNIQDWSLNLELRNKFLSYLQNYYLIPQSYKNSDDIHFKSVASKLIF